MIDNVDIMVPGGRLPAGFNDLVEEDVLRSKRSGDRKTKETIHAEIIAIGFQVWSRKNREVQK